MYEAKTGHAQLAMAAAADRTLATRARRAQFMLFLNTNTAHLSGA
jgi:hypothetical protein